MEQIPPNGVQLVKQDRQMADPWRFYFVTKDNQLQSDKPWEPTPAIPDGDVDSTTVQVFGAKFGDKVVATHDKLFGNNVLVSAHVEDVVTIINASVGIIRVVVLNKTGAPLTIAAGTVYVTVFRRQ